MSASRLHPSKICNLRPQARFGSRSILDGGNCQACQPIEQKQTIHRSIWQIRSGDRPWRNYPLSTMENESANVRRCDIAGIKVRAPVAHRSRDQLDLPTRGLIGWIRLHSFESHAMTSVTVVMAAKAQVRCPRFGVGLVLRGGSKGPLL